ncbi:MAG: 16S rRNA (adenine(1518)-N(6)/adenine(1519)-N(6))-dimethyltransferase RsmA [Candidatus Saccharibacteria bacterium]|nr:16S rRNA (adenine(1518)-N(6)/adenine(1519)-N(6))-dimethyltransferase RsmA [Candidatus Saccharibacteria bacterium]
MKDTPYAKKSLGQHWLHDDNALEAMCHAADINNEDAVLEIGPGLGTLTAKLVKSAREVVAVEFDELLARELLYRVPEENLKVVQQDIMSFDLTSLPKNYKLVANIPYYLTSNLIRVISESANPPIIAALLVQKEVAERVTAEPGSMSLLSVSAQFYWEVSSGLVVPSELFTPSPKVDSQVLVLRRRERLLFSDVDEKQFFRVVNAGFSNRRKTLHNSLAASRLISERSDKQSDREASRNGAGKGKISSKQGVLAILEAAEIDPKSRPQELSMNQWYKLYQAVNQA